MGQIARAIWDRNDRAKITNRLKCSWVAKRRKKFGLHQNTQVAPSTTAPFAPEMCEETQTMAALLRIRSTDAGKVKIVHSKNCKLRPNTIAVGDQEEEAKQGDAAAPQLRATACEANVAVPRGECRGPTTYE